MRQSDAAIAQQHLTAALSLFREIDDTRAAAGVLNQLGMAALYAGRHAQATELLEEGLALAMRQGVEPDASGTPGGGSLSGFRVNMALAALFEGHFERAVEYAEAVLSDSGANRWNYALACATLGAARLGHNDLPGAMELFQEGLRTAQPDGYALPLLYCLAGAAISAARLGDTLAGARLLGAFEANALRLGWPLSPGFQTLYSIQVGAARNGAVPELWEAAFTKGKALTLDAAVEEALHM
jgi:tetratricopeptide (TPR) repeat protein